MKVLILGGTKFLGRHLIDAALAKNHEVTIFHRGKHEAEKLENVEEIFGDRNSDLEKLENRTWDVVIDTCGYFPNSVNISVEALKNSVSKYVFISSISVVADFSKPDYDENAELAKLTPDQEKEFIETDQTKDFDAAKYGEMYGALKVLCEKEVLQRFPENHLIIRPGLIVGKFDFTDRFTYWVMRTARGGEVLTSGDPQSFVQFIDAKDLAEWTINLIEQDATGIFNATGKPFELTMKNLLDDIKKESGSDAEFTWVNGDFLEENKVAPWMEMPLYLPEAMKNLQTANVDKALEKGLKFRPLNEIIRDVLDWRETDESDLRAGISKAREKELLEKWHEQNS